MTSPVYSLLANSRGQSLLEHSKLVGKVAREMGRFCGLSTNGSFAIGAGFDPLDILEVTGWGHDIGKAIKSFQSVLNKSQEEDAVTEWPYHHEISWAYLANAFDCVSHNKLILNAIYWHHAKPVGDRGQFYTSKDEILSRLKERDIKDIARFAENFEWSKGFRTDCESCGDIASPSLFAKDGGGQGDENARIHILRSCLIAADRLVSALPQNQFQMASSGLLESDKLVNQLIPRICEQSPSLPKGYDAGRFKSQSDIAERASKSKTTIVRAPAGFGKTMVGLLWALKSGKSLIWVTPRNIVAEAVYQNICREIDALGIEVSVELFLTGHTKEIRGTAEEFGSDIVVTNIDSILNPMVDNRTAGRLFRVLGCSMVLDEFHELTGDSPLYAAFITLMRARHRLCGDSVQSLMLSATPGCTEFLWDTDSRKTVHLPEVGQHFPPAHTGKYRVFMENVTMDDSQRTGRLSIFNTVSKAQEEFNKGHYAYLAHSKFIEKDRERIFKGIFSDFGKGGQGVSSGQNVCAALVIQAALDVSFLHLDERICSPDFTLQRIGRVNRWGTFNDCLPTIKLMVDPSNNDKAAIKVLYDKKLQKLWVQTLEENFKESRDVNLVEIYGIYNDFYRDHQEDIRSYIMLCYKSGIQQLTEYSPIKLRGFVPLEDTPNNERGRSKKSLRNPSMSYFFTVRIKGSQDWIKPEDIMDESIELRRRFEKGENEKGLLNSTRMQHMLKAVVKCGYPRFRRYTRGKKLVPDSTKRWFNLARNPETPLPDFTREYDSKLGLLEI